MKTRRTRILRKALLAALGLLLLTLSGTAYAAQDTTKSARRPAAPPAHAPGNRWYDRAHGHDHYYPSSGLHVRTLPPRANLIVWANTRYWFSDGIWYAALPTGYIVARPPFGIVVPVLPVFRTVVVLGGVTYFYVNGVYYIERPIGGYEVVPPPVTSVGNTTGAPGRLYVYPREGQSPEHQATDEYECHRWAVSQSGFDPTPAATGQPTNVTHRADYVRAQTACLEARGYTVR